MVNTGEGKDLGVSIASIPHSSPNFTIYQLSTCNRTSLVQSVSTLREAAGTNNATLPPELGNKRCVLKPRASAIP